MTAPMVTWAELHAGDAVLGRDGRVWTVTAREVAPRERRWLAAPETGGGALFSLTCDDGRTVKAVRALADLIPLVARADHSDVASACDAAIAAGLEIEIIREGVNMDGGCQHPEPERSTLRDGRVYCTACFETLVGEPGGIISTFAEADVPQLVDSAASVIAAVIDAQVEDIRPCTENGHSPIAIMDGSTWCTVCKTTLIAAGGAASALSDPPATVASVTVVEPAPPAPAVLDEPAPRPAVPGEPKISRGRYVLPDPVTMQERTWTRASTLARVLPSEYMLERWQRRMVARGVAISKDLIALAASAPADDRDTLNDVAEKAMNRAKTDEGANMGSALHAFTHRRARGETVAQMHMPADMVPDLEAYVRAMRDHALSEIPDLVERTVVNTHIGAAGTLDRIVGQAPTRTNPNPWPYSVLDLKTSKTVEWSWLEWAVQLAVYAHADYLWDPATGTYTPMPPGVIDATRALILHVPVGLAQAHLYALDIARGWEYAQLAEQARQARNSSRGLGWLIEPDAETLLVHRISTADQAELARLWDRHYPAGEWTQAAQAAASERMAVLSADLA